MPRPRKSSDGQWIEIGDRHDDFIKTVGKFSLRVEKMDRNRWWWCVYHKNEQMEAGLNARTGAIAKRNATRFMNYMKNGGR